MTLTYLTDSVQACNSEWSSTDSSPFGVQQRLHCSTDKNETWRQSLLCGRPSCMEQSTSSSSWSWQLASFRRNSQAQNTSVYFMF